MNATRTSPLHARQPEAWHQCWDEYNRLNAEIRDLQVEKSDSVSQPAKDFYAREIKARREKQRRAIANSLTYFVPAPVEEIDEAIQPDAPEGEPVFEPAI